MIVACGHCAETGWDVFYEKASNVKAALAAILIGSSELRSVPRVFYPHSQGVLRWTRCMMGYHRLGAAISTAASKAQDAQRSRRYGGSDSRSDRTDVPLT